MMKRIRSWLLPSLPSLSSLASLVSLSSHQTPPDVPPHVPPHVSPQKESQHETSIYANMTPFEKRGELIRVMSTESMYKDIMNHYHEQINILENIYKTSSSAEDKRLIRKRIHSIHTDLYECVHEWSLLKQQKEILEDELYPISIDNEF